MFSGSFHIMLAAVTRYAVGLVYVPEKGTEPESVIFHICSENAGPPDCRMYRHTHSRHFLLHQVYISGQALPQSVFHLTVNSRRADGNGLCIKK